MFIRTYLPRLIAAFCTGYITAWLIDLTLTHYQWGTAKNRLDDVIRQQQEGIDAVKRIFS